MRLQLDFNTQTLKVEGEVSLGELIPRIQDMIFNWEDWKIEAVVELADIGTSPITINPSTGQSSAYPEWYNLPSVQLYTLTTNSDTIPTSGDITFTNAAVDEKKNN